MNEKAYLYLSGLIFSVVGVSHLLRAFYRVELRAGEWELPIGLSWIGGVAAIGLGLWAWGLARR